MTEEKPQCPYPEGQCPMVKHYNEHNKTLQWKVDIAIALIILFHGIDAMTWLIS